MEEKQNQTIQSKARQPASQIETGEDHEPKISIVEIVFITPFYLISDAIDLALFSFGLDDFGLMDLTRTSISQVYFIMFKKMGPEIWITNLVFNSFKLIPYLGSLLPSTLFWLVAIFIDRKGMAKFKKILEKTGKIGKMAKNVGRKIGKVTRKV